MAMRGGGIMNGHGGTVGWERGLSGGRRGRWRERIQVRRHDGKGLVIIYYIRPESLGEFHSKLVVVVVDGMG
jgi:hypothetical protein